MPTLSKRVLPSLWVSEREYGILEEVAGSYDLTVCELLESIVGQVVQSGSDAGMTFCVVQIPMESYQAFEAWIVGGDESADDAIARFIDFEGKRLAKRIEEIEAGTAS